jgi:hypothetical protein
MHGCRLTRMPCSDRERCHYLYTQMSLYLDNNAFDFVEIERIAAEVIRCSSVECIDTLAEQWGAVQLSRKKCPVMPFAPT